jgi:hypothetical protein
MALKIRVGVRCRTCGKTYANPFTHTCQVRTDFKARRRAADRHADAQKRRARAAARQKAAAAAKRAKAAERRRAAADKRRAVARAKRNRPARPARPPHDYRTCTDPACHRYACLAWKEAFQEGRTSGLEDGYEEGYAAGKAGS